MSKFNQKTSADLRRYTSAPRKKGRINTSLPDSLQNYFSPGTIHKSCHVAPQAAEQSACLVCGAVYKEGHWQWPKSGTTRLPETICPACHQIEYNLPKGFLTLSGEVVRRKHQTVFNLVRERERRERALHPLHRIISIEEYPDRLLIATTDTRLPMRIGQAMRHTCKGRLTVRYEGETGFIHVNWTSGPKRSHHKHQMKRRKS